MLTLTLLLCFTRASGDQSDEGRSLGQGLIDLEAAREEVVAEVLNAPKRRVDNEVSRLTDSVSILQMHCSIMEDVTTRYRSSLLITRLSLLGVSTVSITTPLAMIALGITSVEIIAPTALFGVIGTSIFYWWSNKNLNELANKLLSSDELELTYKKIYARRIAERDEFTSSLWRRVYDHIQMSIIGNDLQSMEKVRKSDLNQLENVLSVEIPRLRRSSTTNTF